MKGLYDRAAVSWALQQEQVAANVRDIGQKRQRLSHKRKNCGVPCTHKCTERNSKIGMV
jgi:hypothetical protein